MLDEVPFAEALGAFKRDCNENELIARLLRNELRQYLFEPVLDVGAGSGELASLAFPDLSAILLDVDVYNRPANSMHQRLTDNFLRFDAFSSRPATLVFAHSMNYFLKDVETFNRQVAASGAATVIVVSNERTGLLEAMADWLAHQSEVSDPFHIPLAIGKLERQEVFTAQLSCANFRTMARHFVRVLLDAPVYGCELIEQTELKLRSLVPQPTAPIDQTICCYTIPT